MAETIAADDGGGVGSLRSSEILLMSVCRERGWRRGTEMLITVWVTR